MKSEFEYLPSESDKAPELALVRLIGQPAGPAGEATIEIGGQCMFVVDAAEPTQIVETLLRAPVKDSIKGLLRLIVGDEVTAAVENDGHSFEIEQTPHLVTLGRLGLLYLVRDAMPVPTLPGVWNLEAARLAHSVPHRLLQKHAIDELFGAEDNLQSLQARFRNAPDLDRLVRSISGDMVPVDVLDHLDGLVDWFHQTEREPFGDLVPVHDELEGSFSISWDQVGRGVVDLRENAVTIEPVSMFGNHQGIRLSVPAQPRAAQKGATLFAHIIDRSDNQAVQTIPFTLSGNGKFEAIGIVPKGLRIFDVFITDQLEGSPPSEEVRHRHRARREAFRALFLERRSQISVDASLVSRASSHWQQSAESYDLIGRTDLAGKARRYASSGASKVQPFAAELNIPVDVV